MNAEPEPLRYTGHLLRRAQQLHATLWIRMVSHEVTSVQFAALAVLERRPGISQRDLGGELDLDRSTIADMVTRMARRGVVTREQSASDRRRNTLSLTPEGRAELTQLRPGVQEVEAALTTALSADERATLRSLLRILLVHGSQQGLLSTPTRKGL